MHDPNSAYRTKQSWWTLVTVPCQKRAAYVLEELELPTEQNSLGGHLLQYLVRRELHMSLKSLKCLQNKTVLVDTCYSTLTVLVDTCYSTLTVLVDTCYSTL